MSDARDTQAFDAFGEKTPVAVPAFSAGARRTVIAVFWSLALLIVAGRVHYGPELTAPVQTVALASR